MAADRNGNRLRVGDQVLLTQGMSVDGIRDAHINNIDGEYIIVVVQHPKDGPIEAERYGNEMWKVKYE